MSANDSVTTTDFSDFGWRERRMAADLLLASCVGGFPDDFEDSGVVLMMNRNSGNVFFTNDECQVAMMNGNRLESFYSCPECGAEGFKDDIHEGDTPADMSAACVRYLRDIGIDDERTEEEDTEEEDTD